MLEATKTLSYLEKQIRQSKERNEERKKERKKRKKLK